MGTLKFLLIARLKRSSKAHQKSGGFTLLELLVGLVLTFLIIGPLLGFVVNVMNTDRQEQAKVRSEQELQAAMEYISRDLQQAVYIYDSDALNNNYRRFPTATNPSGIKDQLPDASQVPNGVPVLVFWKRKLIPKSLPLDPNATSCLNPTQCNDAFVYSLVAYYLIKDTNPNPPWSGTTRIGRFELQDGVQKIDGDYVNQNDPRIGRDQGFKVFNLDQSNVSRSMNTWQNSGESFPATKLPQNNILVDYIDQSTTATAQETYAGATPPYCPPRPANLIATDPGWKQVPDYTNGGIPPEFQTFSFYACVLSSQNTARVFLRGNALARIKNVVPSYDASLSSFFPTLKTEVKSSAGLGGG